MKHFDRIIFVDFDDTTRAPMAAAIMKSKYLMGQLEIESRGLVALFPEPVNQKAEAILISKGLSVKGYTATQLSQEDLNDRTLLITMEDEQKEKIWSSYEHVPHMYTIAEYNGLQGDMATFYGEPLTGYGKCYEMLDALVNGLVVRFNKEELS